MNKRNRFQMKIISMILAMILLFLLVPRELISVQKVQATPVSNSSNTLTIDKTAVRVGFNRFEVTLNIKGNPERKPADIVLVMDCSGSMGDRVKGDIYSSLYYAKKAAINFVNKTLDENPSNRVSIVSFSSAANIEQKLSNDREEIIQKIEDLKAGGATNIYDGFIKAKEEMDARGRDKEGVNRAIVLLSDGVPNSPRWDDPQEKAIEAGKDAQKSADVYTVGLLGGLDYYAKQYARDILNECQNAGCFKSPDGKGLENVYDKIRSSINYATKNSKVIDIIDSRFDLAPDSFSYDKGEAPIYNKAKREITWNVGTVGKETATLKYQLIPKAGVKGSSIPTNDWAKLFYEGNLQGLSFPRPMVDVIDDTSFLTLNKTAKSTGNFREYEVDLSIKGFMPPKDPLDVVLVIDKSGSMNYKADYYDSESSMYYVKKAARTMSSKILADSNNRVAIVSFNETATVDQNFCDNLSIVSMAIDNLGTPSGGTNIDYGFTEADSLLKKGREGAKKVIVLLSDGVANCQYENGKVFYENIYLYGTGRPQDINLPEKHTYNTVAAYEAGQVAQKNSLVVTIGLLGAIKSQNQKTYEVAKDTLNKAQNGGYYESLKGLDVESIYDKIFTTLNYLAKESAVTDMIPESFELVPDSFEYSMGTDAPIVEGNKITWNSRTIGENQVNLKYRLRAKDNYYGEKVPTNIMAELNYKDYNDRFSTKEFPRPTVEVPKLSNSLTMEKKVFLDSECTVEVGEENVPFIGDTVYYKFIIKNDGELPINSVKFKDLNISLKNAKLYSYKENSIIRKLDDIQSDTELMLKDSLEKGDGLVVKGQFTIDNDKYLGGIINTSIVEGVCELKHVEINIENATPKQEKQQLRAEDSNYMDIRYKELAFVGENHNIDFLYAALIIILLMIIGLGTTISYKKR